MKSLLKENDLAPDFTLPDETGIEHNLSEFKGKTIVLYFYPKDDTPGCTKEACSFRDNFSQLTSKGAIVIGISKDSPKSHEKFKIKYNLPFILLADEKAEVIKLYDCWGTKNMYGKIIEGTLRKTFIIDKNGIIKKIFEKVTPEGHAEEILKYI
ncbi:MAG: thioredoxin-dependent thiol peroxidase [Spirochaetales bacterium]|jgi:peroxiredoxin Q/BCP|nr:thioredoxin-dependent thiol peroxidase [Exilispira sp.]NMC67995.1 thioredoxin-dependent thiol peroxidase [Spirochaetales bacterium]